MQLNMLTSVVKAWELAGTKEPPPPEYNPKSVPGDSADTAGSLGGSMGTFGLEMRHVLSDFEHVWYMADKTRLAGDHQKSYHLWAVLAAVTTNEAAGIAHLHLAAGLANSRRYVEALQVYSKLITCGRLARDRPESSVGESDMYDDIAADEDSDTELRVLCRGATNISTAVVEDAIRHRASVFQLLQESCMEDDQDSWRGPSSYMSSKDSGKKEAAESEDDEEEDERGAANGRDFDSDETQQRSKLVAPAVTECREVPVCDGLDGLASSAELSMAMEWPTAPIRARLGLHDPKRVLDMQLMPDAEDRLRAMYLPSFRAGFGAEGKVGTQRAARRAAALAEAAVQHAQQQWVQSLSLGGAVLALVVAAGMNRLRDVATTKHSTWFYRLIHSFIYTRTARGSPAASVS